MTLIPAHNEASLIGITIATLRSELRPGIRLLVVADNCRDDTAGVARSSGAEVIERCDSSKRGKGFALDYGRTHLQSDPPDVVLILDADCVMDGPSADALIAACAATKRPCQATYLLMPAPQASTGVQMSTFAFCLKNLVRQRGLQRLAGQVHLTGTGMAFPWEIFDRASLATASIVEDLELGIALAEQGSPAYFVEEARVWSEPASDAATFIQRTRWEGGFLATMRTAAPRALIRAVKQRDGRALWTAMNLCVPPVTLLMLLNFIAFGAGATLIALTAMSWWPMAPQIGATALAFGAIITAWHIEGRAFVGARALSGAPLYLARKLCLYAGLARGGAPREWQRTDRS